MDESQPEDVQVIQDFLNEFKKQPRDIWRSGRVGAESDVEHKYVPEKTLQERIPQERVQELLDALFDNWDKAPPDAEYIRTRYLRTFTILLVIGFGRKIYYVYQYPNLQDQYLPFRAEPPDFPYSTKANLFSKFNKAQWGFCAHKMAYNMNNRLGTDDILPINDKEIIEEGGSAITYKVIIDEDYNALLPHEDEDLASKHQHRNTFVLKTYRTRDAKTYYETECNGFRKLRWNGKPPSNIVAFYGSFVREGTYNIILEYADIGNLDRFMQQTHPPSTPQERSMFWGCFFDVLNGLVRIHGEDESKAQGPQILLGWHQDVNPTNILVKSRKGKSCYDCHFKLSDLGLAHFKKYLSALGDATDNDTFGTSAYGAPETRRTDMNLEKSKLKIKQDVDIWSMGCVISEVVTWVNQGWDKVAEYRRRRLEEMEELTGKREDCFHNQWSILSTVNQVHQDIVTNRRMNDDITPAVVESILPDMLVLESGSRLPATILYRKSKRIIAGTMSSRQHAAAGSSFASGPVATTPKKRPPQLPPGHSSGDSGGSTRSRHSPPVLHARGLDGTAVFDDETQDPGIPIGQSLQHTRGQPSSNSHSHALYNRYDEHHYGRFSSRHPYTDYQHVQLAAGHTRASSNEAHKSHHQVVHSDPLVITKDTEEERGRSDEAPLRRQTRTFPLQEDHRKVANAGASRPSPVPHQIDPNGPGELPPIPATALDQPPANGEILDTPSARIKQNEGRKLLPELSVEAGLRLKKEGHTFAQNDLFEKLRKRDHAFLIDNSGSSLGYRASMRKVLELLAYMVKDADPDGPDLYFTSPFRKLKRKNVHAILSEFDKTPAQGIPDMRECFASILNDYQDRLGKKEPWNRIRHPFSTPSRGPRKLSLYVLSDGVWQPKTNLILEVETLVRRLEHHSLMNKQVGIQFIRFGDDPQAIRRMRKLDSGLKLTLDIVDTTPADGNVWKMLLGPINDWADDDDDEEAEDNGPGYHEKLANDIDALGIGRSS